MYNLILVTWGSKIGDIPLSDPIVIQIKRPFPHAGVSIFVFVISLFIFIVLYVVYLSTDHAGKLGHVLSACGKCICSICICTYTCILSPPTRKENWIMFYELAASILRPDRFFSVGH